MLITGAGGRIGSDLVKFFSQKHKVYATCRNHNSITRNLRNKNIVWIKHDIKNKFLKNIRPKIIIHCAGAHSYSMKNHYNDHIDSNIIGFSRILEFAKKNKVEKIFHISSIDIYGDVKNNILDESDPYINPTMLGCTKIWMEKMISDQKIDYLNIRVPGVVGYQVNDPRFPWLCKIVNKLKNNKKIEIHNGQKLFNNILDTLEIYKFINHVKKKKLKRESINLSATRPINLKKFIFHIRHLINSKSKVLIKKDKANHFTISNKKVISLYNYKASTTLEIVNRYIKSFKHLI